MVLSVPAAASWWEELARKHAMHVGAEAVVVQRLANKCCTSARWLYGLHNARCFSLPSNSPTDLHQICNEWGQSKYPMVPGGWAGCAEGCV